MVAEFYLSDGSDCSDYMETTRHTVIVVIVAIEATAKYQKALRTFEMSELTSRLTLWKRAIWSFCVGDAQRGDCLNL